MLKTIRGYLDYMKQVKNYSQTTVRGYRNDLIRFTGYLSGHHHLAQVKDILPEHIYAYQQYLTGRQPPYKPSYIHKMISVINIYFNYLLKTRQILINPAAGIILPKYNRGLPKEILTEKEIVKLLHSISLKDSYGVRNRAILELFYAVGIRLRELINLNTYDIDLDAETVIIRLGKGGKDRLLPLGRHAWYWLEKYINTARERLINHLRLNQPALFLTSKGNRVTTDMIHILFRDLRRKSGIRKRVYPHGIRHATASHLVRHGADLRSIQQLLGHSSVITTQIYLQTQTADIKQAYLRAHPRDKIKLA